MSEHYSSKHTHSHTTFILENLGCAHCASKMEAQIRKLPGVEDASITFATKQLRIKAEHAEALLPEIQNICASIESAVRVHIRSSRHKAPAIHSTEHQHVHDEHCDCGHKHHSHQHTHDEHCDCGHEHHAHQHTHDEHCDCGHEHHEHSHEHHHEHGEHCDCGHAHHHSSQNEKQEFLLLLLGAALFAAGIVFNLKTPHSIVTLLIFIVSYLILGSEILLEAGRNILRGHVFDENFLMGIATLGAFAIQEYPEAVGVMLFYRIGEYFEHKAVERSRSQIMDAIDMRPETVTLLHENATKIIPAEDAQPGDLLLIHPGDRIPLDGKVIEGESRLDTSPLTGEPVPVIVSPGEHILSGCVNTSGQLTLLVEKPLSESMVTRILDSVENAAASKPRIDRFITRFSRVYTPCVVILALAVAILPSLFTGEWNYWIYTALTFLVMSCPCALVLSVPLAFFSGIGAGSKKGILFKGGASMEALSSVRAVVLDKTGTITQGNFQLQEIITTEPFSKEELLRICASCEQHSTHPIAHSIVTAAQEQNLSLESPNALEELPGHGISAVLISGNILCGNHKLMDKYQIRIPDMPENLLGSEVFVAVNGIFAGYLQISDTIKPDAQSAIRELKSSGLHTAMLTGDSQVSAQAVASKIGIDEVYAKLLPEDKLRLVQEIRARHGAVLFVGDGINDAPVLAGADVSAAMGSGADAAIEAADTVFMTANVESIPMAISISRSANRIALQNVIFALTIKIATMILGLLGFANMWIAVFADSGVAMLCVLNSIRILYKK